MLNHKGTTTIYTKRLILRAIDVDDYKDIYKYTVKGEVAKYVSWTPHKSIEETKAICEKWVSEYVNGDRYNWAIVYNNTVIGNIDVLKIVDEIAVMGWQIDSLHWNKGIMTEAATAVRDYLFSDIGINRMEASYLKENIASGKVMRKIKMRMMTVNEVRNSVSFKLNGFIEINGMPLVNYVITRNMWENLKCEEQSDKNN